jgi:hypothetical protein
VGGGSYGQLKTYPDGRQVQKNKDSVEIDKRMIKLTGKEHPKIVFIGAADGDKQTITEIISKNGAKIYKLTEQRQKYNKDTL